MSRNKQITTALGVAIVLLATPALASSSSLECRDTSGQLLVIKEEVKKFNHSVDEMRVTQRRLFETSSIFGDADRFGLTWSHVFGATPYEPTDKPNENLKQWFYPWVKLTVSDSDIIKNDQNCVWVSSEHLTDIYEVKTNLLTKTISKNITTDK